MPGTGLGYGNEFEVARAVWDLLDGAAGAPASTDADPTAILLADFLASLAGLTGRAPPDFYVITWLPSLLQQLIDDSFLSIADANTVMSAQGAQFPPAGGPDPWPGVLTVGGGPAGGNLDAYGGADPNPVLGPQANALYRLTLASAQSVNILLTNGAPVYSAPANRLDLSLWDLDRNLAASDASGAQNKAINIALAAGTYIVRVQHLPASQASSASTPFTIEVTP